MLRRLISAETSSPDLFCLAGVVSESRGKKSEAESLFRKALYLDPGHLESLAHLALLLEIDGRHAAARPLRQRASKLSPTP